MKHLLLPLVQIASLASVMVCSGVVRFVDVSNANPTRPYTNWIAAATNIQDAIDAADPGDLVLVTNGVYQAGGATVGDPFSGFISNRVAVTKPLTIQSVNGPTVTTIMGSHGDGRLGTPFVRCVFLTNDAALFGFTLTNGQAGSSGNGGGAYAVSSYPFPPTAVLSNCVLTGNTAIHGGGANGVLLNNCVLTGNSGSSGGGAFGCVLNRCVISGNTLPSSEGPPGLPPAGYGGGAYHSTMNSCLVVGNSAFQGGGACGGLLKNCTIVSNTAALSGGVYQDATTVLTNCIVFNNSATNGPNYQAGPVFSYCCTTPLPTGIGNITNNPLFLRPSIGDYHTQTNSPCINAGNNSAVDTTFDLDANPRVAGGTVDIGAYEFQAPASIISYAWLQQYGFPTDGSADFLDSDGDGMSNWQEWRAGTDPTDRLSVLHISSISVTGTAATVRWQGESGVSYCIERSTNLLAQPAFLPVQSNIAGIAGTLVCPQTNTAGVGPVFYRLRVQ